MHIVYNIMSFIFIVHNIMSVKLIVYNIMSVMLIVYIDSAISPQVFFNTVKLCELEHYFSVLLKNSFNIVSQYL